MGYPGRSGLNGTAPGDRLEPSREPSTATERVVASSKTDLPVPGAGPDFNLLVQRDARVVARAALHGMHFTIGRSSSCDLVLDHPSVSRQHVRFERRGHAWVLIDLDSRNGVLVNGQSARQVTVCPGDRVEIRPFTIDFAGPGAPRASDLRLLDTVHLRTALSMPIDQVNVAHQRLEDLYELARRLLNSPETARYWAGVQAALRRSLDATRCGGAPQLLRLCGRADGERARRQRLRVPRGVAAETPVHGPSSGRVG